MACSKVSDVCDDVKKCQDVFSGVLKLKFSNTRPTLGDPGVGNVIFYMSYMRRKNCVSNGLKWVCRKKACASEASFHFDSWFSCIKLNLEEIYLLTFFMVTGTKTKFIQNFFFSSSIMAESLEACEGHITNM